MANTILTKSIIQDTGITTNTWKVQSMNIDASGQAVVMMAGYISEVAYTDGKKPVCCETVFIANVAQIPAVKTALDSILVEVMKDEKFVGSISKSIAEVDKL